MEPKPNQTTNNKMKPDNKQTDKEPKQHTKLSLTWQSFAVVFESHKATQSTYTTIYFSRSDSP